LIRFSAVGALVGEVVGNYRIGDLVGTGGMGAVYRAEHVLLGKRAAVKVLLPERCASREIIDRFFNEAKAASLIKDPGIVEIFDFGRLSDGNAYIVMELLEGETLGDRLKRQRLLSPNHACSIARHVAGTLAAAHAHKIIHRDLKPDNVFLVKDPAMPRGERTKLLDFGIAKLQSNSQPSELVKTETGRLMGTPYYMSPEQCRGAGKVDHRTDVYSLGCVLYQMLAGRPPFVLEGAGEILAAHIHIPAPSPRVHEPSIPPSLERMILKMLEKDPDLRYQSMTEVVNSLNDIVLKFSSDDELPEPSLSESDRFRPRAGSPRPYTPPLVTEATTLNSTSGELRTDPTLQEGRRSGLRRLVPWLVAAALAVAAGAAMALAIHRTSSDDQEGAARAEAPPPMSEPAAAAGLPEAVVDATPSGPIVRELSGSEDDEDMVNLLILTQPDGATVYREADGVRLGRTPLPVKVRRGLVGEAAFIVRRSGYRTERIAVPIAEDQEVLVTLRGKTERSAVGPAAAPAAVTATPTEKKGAPNAASPPAPPAPEATGAGDKPKRGKDDAINPFGELLNRIDGEKK
jgi:eukaryotic-like serine/threonine-protein kinase